MTKTSMILMASVLCLGLACDKGDGAGNEEATKTAEADAPKAKDKKKKKAKDDDDDDEAEAKDEQDDKKKEKADEVDEIDVESLLEAEDASGVLSQVDFKGLDDSKAPSLGRDIAEKSETIQQAEWLDLPGALQIPFPSGWIKRKQGNVGVIASADQKAAILFTTVTSEPEVVKALDEVGKAAGITQVQWKQPQKVQLGPDGLPALVRGGDVATGQGQQGKVLFAIIETNEQQKLLAIGIKDGTASDAVSKAGQQVLLSIRKKKA